MKRIPDGLYAVSMGLLGGAAAWAGIETILMSAARFPDFRVLSWATGAAAGLLMGAVAPAAEGIRQKNSRKAWTGPLVGAVVGLVAGVIGMALGQMILTALIESARLSGSQTAAWGTALARLPGWIVLGGFIGMVGGLRSRSLRRIVTGLLGGVIGGLIGGIAAELLSRAVGRPAGRGIGLAVWGMAVAFLADVFERRSARGKLTVLAGPMKGRSLPVNQKRLLVAPQKKADLTIPGIAADDAGGAEVTLKKGTVVVKPSGKGEVLVNDEKVTERTLMYDDVVKVGDTTMIYEARR